jgi:crotonobetainyl-CoA:carnitine CoA-transferase CaiB-like acyl-CoA transferase
LNYLVSGVPPRRLGTAHPNIVPYQVFAVSDGHIMLAVGNDSQYRKLCNLLGNRTLGMDPRFATNADRVAHRGELVTILSGCLRKFTREGILARLAAEGVPGGPINTVEDVFADPQITHRAMRIDAADETGTDESVPGVRTPICFSESSLATPRRAPRLGEYTDAFRRLHPRVDPETDSPARQP